MESHPAQPDAPTQASRAAAHTAMRAGLSSGSAAADLEAARRGVTSTAAGALVVADENIVLVAWSGPVRVYVVDPTGPELHHVTVGHTGRVRLRAPAAGARAVEGHVAAVVLMCDM